MKEIAPGVYIEDAYPGVTLGAFLMKKGIVLIDAPPRPDDGRSWLAALRSMGAGKDRLLVILDSHPDRSLGTRILDSTVVAQENTAYVFNRRSAVFKGQSLESGAEWETCSGLSGIRWLSPGIFFDQRTELHWGEHEVILEHHPGPEPGAAWLLIPDLNIVFVGDALVLKQPPFLANANLEVWTETLDVLLSKDYKNFSVISSRGGPVPSQAIRQQRKYLREILKQLQRLAKRKASPEATEKLVPKLLSNLDFPARHKTLYSQRLRYGLYHYYVRHYHPAPQSQSD